MQVNRLLGLGLVIAVGIGWALATNWSPTRPPKRVDVGEMMMLPGTWTVTGIDLPEHYLITLRDDHSVSAQTFDSNGALMKEYTNQSWQAYKNGRFHIYAGPQQTGALVLQGVVSPTTADKFELSDGEGGFLQWVRER